VVLSVPTLCWAYFVQILANTAAGRFVQMGLLMVVVSQALPNMATALGDARDKRGERIAFERDMAAGVPVSLLSQRHRPFLFPAGNPIFMEQTTSGMLAMHQKGKGKFRQLAPNPPYQQIQGPRAPAVLHQVRWADGVAHGFTGEAYFDFFLERPRHVYAVRMTCAFPEVSQLPAKFSLSWKTGTQREFPGAKQTLELAFEDSQVQTVTIWVNETIDRLRIHPDTKPFLFRLAEMTLCVPEAGELAGDSAALPLYRLGTRIDLTQASSGNYLIGDRFGAEMPWQWSGPRASVRFRLESVRPVRLRIMANAFNKQRIMLSLNEREITTLEWNGAELEISEIDLPLDALANVNTLMFTLPDARTPQSLGIEDDSRVLGMGVAWLEFVPVTSNAD
jgi:hypothetical protein